MAKKNDFLSPKAIDNRSKMKGLQKLKFFCQLCEKQCRDQNGFKQHCSSEQHLRQVKVFGENSARFIRGYSEEFLGNFLNMLALSHRNSRVSATVAYNEYIANKTHVHMNSTKWTTLTDFVKYLGREKLCEIEETPKGWFLQYKPRDKEEQLRERMIGEKKRIDEDEDTRNANLLAKQIAKQNKIMNNINVDVQEIEATAIDLENEQREKIEMAARVSIVGDKRKMIVDDKVSGMFVNNDDDDEKKKKSKTTLTTNENKKKKKLKWMRRTQIVCRKIKTGEKGTVVRANVDNREADVKLKDSGTVLQNVEEHEFEPVCPGIGGKCVVVRNHDLVGEEGKVLSVNAATGEVTIESFKRAIHFKANSADVARIA